MLLCRNCGVRNEPDPGGNPAQYRCGNCQQPTLYRKEDADKQTVGFSIIGGLVGGLLVGTGIGALLGAIIGGVVGRNSGRRGQGQP